MSEQEVQSAQDLSLADRRANLVQQIAQWERQILMAQGYIKCLDDVMAEDGPELSIAKKEQDNA